MVDPIWIVVVDVVAEVVVHVVLVVALFAVVFVVGFDGEVGIVVFLLQSSMDTIR